LSSSCVCQLIWNEIVALNALRYSCEIDQGMKHLATKVFVFCWYLLFVCCCLGLPSRKGGDETVISPTNNHDVIFLFFGRNQTSVQLFGPSFLSVQKPKPIDSIASFLAQNLNKCQFCHVERFWMACHLLNYLPMKAKPNSSTSNFNSSFINQPVLLSAWRFISGNNYGI
jgi:hypothetical protein